MTLIHKPFGFFLLLSFFILAGCGSQQSQNGNSSEQLEQGQAVYAANCQSCHGGATGGQIRDNPPRHNANGHTWHHPDCQLIEIIKHGPAAWGGTVTPASMPAFSDVLTDEEMNATLAYIKTWWSDEQQDSQAELTRLNCQD